MNRNLINKFYADELKRKHESAKKNHKLNIITGKKSGDSKVVKNAKTKGHK
jgi:hypothetical protein